MTWKRFPHYWPLPVDSPHEGLVMWSFDFSFDASLIKLMNKQLRSRCTGVSWDSLNTLRPRQNGRHFPDDIFKCIFLNDDVLISITISLKFVPNGPINKIPALVQIMAWRRPGDKLLSEPRMVSLPTHIYTSLGLNQLTLLECESSWSLPWHRQSYYYSIGSQVTTLRDRDKP